MREVKTNTPEALVANVVHLTSLPSIYTRLENTLKDPEHTRDDIANVVSMDPALCARILRIINSSYYALPKTVQNINIAVNLIGEYDFCNMVLVSSVTNSVAALVDDGIDMSVFWRHSIRCGITAKLLAKLHSVLDSDLLFIAGLLHDLGQLIIYKNEPELSVTVAWHVINEHKERYRVEQTLLGFDHAITGAILAENWGLPVKLKEIIEYHHQPERSAHYKTETTLTGLADQLVHFLELNDNLAKIDFDQLPTLINSYLNDLNIPKYALFDVLTDMIEQSQAIEDIICDV